MDKMKTSRKPGADPFEKLVGYQLRRLSVMAMADLADSLDPLGLKPAAASILFELAVRMGQTQSELGHRLGIRRANMAPMIAVLLNKGLVERSAVDGRSQALRLSATGRKLERRAWRTTLLHEKRFFGSLPSTARSALAIMLGELWRRRG